MPLYIGGTKLGELYIGSTKIGEGWMWDGSQWVQVYASAVKHAPQTFTYTSSTNFTVPDWCRYVTLIPVGGGGGGTSGEKGRKGGAAGQWASQTVPVSGGDTVAVTVGARGKGGQFYGNAATPGGATTASIGTVVATGGGGAAGGAAGTAGESVGTITVDGISHDPGASGRGGNGSPTGYGDGSNGSSGVAFVVCYDYRGV